MKEIIYTTGNEELLDEIRTLWEGLNTLHYEKSINFKEHFINSTFEKRKASLISKSSKGSVHVILAYKDNRECIGYCVNSIVDNKGEIESLFVESSFRKYGIGTALMEKSITWLHEGNCQNIIVSVASGNEEAFSFYQKFGFYPKKTELHLKSI